MTTVGQDLRYSLRTLRKSPGFAAAAIGILALGIGANTALFSVVDAVLLRPLPFPEPGQVMRLQEAPPPPAEVGRTGPVSPANYLDWRGQSHAFAALAAYRGGSLTWTGRQEPEALTAATVAGDFFSVLAVRPLLGRVFAPGEEEPGHDDVVILSQALWQSRFGSDPRVLGRELVLDGRRHTVVGVMPALRVAAWYPATVQVWKPLAWTAKERAVRGERQLNVIARLKPGVDRLQAQAEMDTLAGRLAQAYPDTDKGWSAVVQPLHEYLTGRARPALFLLLGAVAFVLLIACANVANLVLVRTLGRSKEMAIRGTLGASRGRLVRQLMAEALLLALAGAALGLYLAHFGVALLVGFLGDLLPPGLDVHLDLRILAFTLGISLFAGLAAGLAPAWSFLRSDPHRALQRGLGRTDATAGGRRTRGALVVAEVALSLVLLLGAALMIESLGVLQRDDPGCDPHGVLTLVLGLPQQQYPQPRQQSAFFDRVLTRLRALPGVEAAATVDQLPLTEPGLNEPVAIPGRTTGALAEQPQVAVRLISPGYLRTLRIALRRGRDFTAADALDRPAVVLISESMARRFWPSEDPVGKRLVLGLAPRVPQEVVGVVADVKVDGLRVEGAVPTVYQAMAQRPWPATTFVVRAKTRPESLVPAVARTIHSEDKDLPLLEVATLDSAVAAMLAQERFSMLLLSAFAGLALLLAAVGIYSVLSYTVGRRAQEIGVRMALGAQVRDVLRLVVVEGMRPTLLGIVLGLGAALALGRALASLFYGVSVADPILFGAVGLVLASVALLASAGPAWRAARVPPSEALQE
ncbi:MAG TPA: ABC transporter permease [Thermoanaerobaculia bacterium]|nr:ABC transporter permease [Thermoanaerobaculia bacterium]